jgi:hypothetical protein
MVLDHFRTFNLQVVGSSPTPVILQQIARQARFITGPDLGGLPLVAFLSG